jgi:hypothetical protein
MAAVLAAGPDAVLSHRSAAALWGILSSERVEVTVPRVLRGPPGVTAHRSLLPADETTKLEGIRVTTVPRTLLDLASVVSPTHLERALNEAEVLRLTDPLSLADLVERHPHRHGIRVVRSVLGEARVVTRSELEVRFRRFLRTSGVPAPALNVRLEGIECDCVWHAQRLVVELDGRAAHDTAAAFERDRARDRMLYVAGWSVVRITWRQLRNEPERITADLKKLLLG